VPTFKATLAYDGTDYVGWQRQATGVSIQSLLEDALRDLDGREVTVVGAGRTDAGVHALGQVASFFLERQIDAHTVVRALNARLPPDVRILAAVEAPATFHARFHAKWKTYLYRIWHAEVASPFERRYNWHVPAALDFDAMARAAKFVEGTHDFAAFQASGAEAKSAVRTIRNCGLRIEDCGLCPSPGSERPDGPIGAFKSAFRNPQSAILSVDISGDGFLRHMVRTIVGSLVEVGRGKRHPEWIQEILVERDRTLAGPTAPAAGLFLAAVEYATDLADEP
jgi:tRNA pseudouridine38-40 synthase